MLSGSRRLLLLCRLVATGFSVFCGMALVFCCMAFTAGYFFSLGELQVYKSPRHLL